MNMNRRISITGTLTVFSRQGAPYRKTFDGVMAHCLQAGLIDKWLQDLYSIYLKEVQDKKTPQEKKKEKLQSAAKRNDGMVSG